MLVKIAVYCLCSFMYLLFLVLLTSQFITLDHPIPQADYAVCMGCDLFFVGNYNYGISGGVNFIYKSHDLCRGFGIQVSCRFIGKDNGRSVDKGAAYSNPLALPTR